MLLKDLLGLIFERKKYWLLPAIVCLLIAGIFLIINGTVVAPFIYALF